MLEAVGEVFPEAKYQRCTVHSCRNVFSVTPRSKIKLVARCSRRPTPKREKTAQEKTKAVVEEVRTIKLKETTKEMRMVLKKH